MRNDETGSRTESYRQKTWEQEAGQRNNRRKKGRGSWTEMEKEALGTEGVL